MPARPFFIVSSGRSGTKMMERLFAGLPGLTMHHEYMVQITQPLATRRYLGLIDTAETRRILRQVHGAAIHYAPLHRMPLYGGGPPASLPATEQVAPRIMTLPISAGMTVDDAQYVIVRLKALMERERGS